MSRSIPPHTSFADLLRAFSPEEQERLVPIMGRAPNLKVVLGRGPAGGERHHVVQLQEPALPAPAV